MLFLILIVVFSLVLLITLHEFGHFILAKKFGVKVEEFGLGIPPRIFGKKFGETIYSINLLPIGAFVKLYGEEKQIKEPRSFSGKPVWQRVLIVLGGVVSFWIISAIILSIIAGVWGLPVSVNDEGNHNLINPKVQITQISLQSPAAIAGLKIGDIIKELKFENESFKTDKIKEVQDFTNLHKGKEITLIIQRGKDVLEITLVPRVFPPEEEGPMGVALVRTALKPYSWYEAPIQGILVTGKTTAGIVLVFGEIISKAIKGVPLPPGLVEVRGPIGITQMATQALERGINEYLWLMAFISIFLAIFNILPLPALDGGKLLFLGIEKVRGKPVNQKIEQNATAIFFILLIAFMIFITVKDIARFF